MVSVKLLTTSVTKCLQAGVMEVNFSVKGIQKYQKRTRVQFGSFLIFCGAFISLTKVPASSAATICPGNQTAELGQRGLITCNFTGDFSFVYWFDNVSESSPVVINFKANDGLKSGPGFESGDYDVHQNGSLIIKNVTTWHERVYKVIVYFGLSHDTYLIPLKVIASPSNRLQAILCHSCHHEYYYSVVDKEIPSCSFNGARPPVQLEWIELSSEGYEHTEMQQLNVTRNSNGTYNSLATLHSLRDSSNFIHLLLCEATWPLSDWRREKGILLDFSYSASFSDITPKVHYMEINRYAKIQCGQSSSVYMVWKRILSSGELEIIGFHSQAMTEAISNTPDVVVSADGSLVFSSPQIHHEGVYACIHGDGQNEEMVVTSVQILVPPSPPYIQIIGCDEVSQSCVFKEDNTKKLTCAVYGVHPTPTLEWIAESEEEITFFNHNTVIIESSETTDITLSVECLVSQDVLCGEDILIRCRLTGPLSKIMKAESTAFVKPASCKENEVKGDFSGTLLLLVISWVAVTLVLWMVLALCLYWMRSIDPLRRTYNGAFTGEPEDTEESII